MMDHNAKKDWRPLKGRGDLQSKASLVKAMFFYG